jgi:hypothetical protein
MACLSEPPLRLGYTVTVSSSTFPLSIARFGVGYGGKSWGRTVEQQKTTV